jgi:hypothetical protein
LRSLEESPFFTTVADQYDLPLESSVEIDAAEDVEPDEDKCAACGELFLTGDDAWDNLCPSCADAIDQQMDRGIHRYLAIAAAVVTRGKPAVVSLSCPTPLAKNVAAIAAELLTDEDAYVRFYNEVAPALNGFPGIWRLAALAGEVLTELEEAYNDSNTPAEAEWVQLIQQYVEQILTSPRPEKLSEMLSVAWLLPRAVAAFQIGLNEGT